MAKTAVAAPAAKKVAAPAKVDPNIITAYNVVTKEKGVTMLKPTIDIKSGRYIAYGLADSGQKLTTIMSKDNAERHIKQKTAKKGLGWS